MAAGLCRGHADEFHRCLLSGGNAGDLSAANSACGDSGRLAAQTGIAGGLLYGCRLAEKGYDVDYILDQALRWHVSTVNIKSSPIPAEWKERFDIFQKKIGYRFILRRLEFPKTVNAGSMMLIHMWWLNAGVAPIYKEFPLAIEMRSPKTATITRVPVDVRKWLPGDAVFDGTLYVPGNLPEDSYDFRVAMLDPRTNNPRFASPMRVAKRTAGIAWVRSR